MSLTEALTWTEHCLEEGDTPAPAPDDEDRDGELEQDNPKHPIVTEARKRYLAMREYLGLPDLGRFNNKW